MKAFFDTSVLVASVCEADHRHQASHDLLMRFSPQQASCAAHTMAELYATLTGLNPPNRLRTDSAILILQQIQARLSCVVLTADEVYQTIQRTASLKLSGGIIYDALLLACARKIAAEHIYTWNVKHFQLVAPDLKDRILTP